MQKKILHFCAAIVILILFIVFFDSGINWTDSKLKLLANILPIVSVLGLFVGL